MKVVLSECDQCHRKMNPDQITRFIWKKKNLKLDLCPDCFTQIWGKHLKEVSMGLEPMVRSGYWDQGAREIDFKSYLEKWAKRLKEQL